MITGDPSRGEPNVSVLLSVASRVMISFAFIVLLHTAKKRVCLFRIRHAGTGSFGREDRNGTKWAMMRGLLFACSGHISRCTRERASGITRRVDRDGGTRGSRGPFAAAVRRKRVDLFAPHSDATNFLIGRKSFLLFSVPRPMLNEMPLSSHYVSCDTSPSLVASDFRGQERLIVRADFETRHHKQALHWLI